MHPRRLFAARAGRWSSALVVAVLAAYSNVFGNAWLFDDEFLVLKNRFLDSFSHLGEIFTSSSTAGAGFHDLFYRPMQIFAYLAVRQTFGREPAAFHALNVGLHAVNALLIFALGRRLKLGRIAAFIGALLWCVHPLHVEAVTYVSATADPLHAAFVLLALNVVVPTFTRARVAIGLVAFVLGLLSKESAIVLPALLVACLYLLEERRYALRSYAKTLPFWTVAVGYFLIRHVFGTGGRGMTFYPRADAYADHVATRVWTSLATLPSYLELILWPHDLHMDRDFPAFTSPWMSDVLGGVVIVALAVVAGIQAYRRPTAGRIFAAFAALWVIGAHAPHAGILLPVNSVFLEHWMYLTSVPLFWGAGLWLARLPGRVPLMLGAAIPTLALAQKTYRQNEIWATPIRFFEHTLSYSPKSARIRHNLAMAMLEAGRVDEGLAQLELMISAGTPYPATYHTAALVYAQRHDVDRAERLFLKALELDPKFYPSVQELVVLYAAKGDPVKSDDFARRLRELRTGF